MDSDCTPFLLCWCELFFINKYMNMMLIMMMSIDCSGPCRSAIILLLLMIPLLLLHFLHVISYFTGCSQHEMDALCNWLMLTIQLLLHSEHSYICMLEEPANLILFIWNNIQYLHGRGKHISELFNTGYLLHQHTV